MTVKLSKTKDKKIILKEIKESYRAQDLLVRLTANFLTEPMEARMQWENTFNRLNEKDCQPRILYPTK